MVFRACRRATDLSASTDLELTVHHKDSAAYGVKAPVFRNVRPVTLTGLVHEAERHHQAQILGRVIPPFRFDRCGPLGRFKRQAHLFGGHVPQDF